MIHGWRLALLTGALASSANLVGPYGVHAQSMYNPRDDQFRSLGLIRAEAEYMRASAAVERNRQLRSRGFLSAQQLEDAEAQFGRARVDYMQQALTVISQGSHITIVRAVKHRGQDERNYLSLTLAESGGNLDARHARAILGDSSLAALQAADVGGVYVSIKSEAGATGATIAWPYEMHLNAAGTLTERTARFRLLRDVDEVVVSVAHGDKVDERKVLLEQDASANLVAIETAEFSQEADLGTQVTFPLRLTRFAHDEKVYHLQVDGLPGDVTYEFRDPDTRARLNQLRFAAGSSRKSLHLVLSLPLRASASLAVDAPIALYVAAFEASSADRPVTERPANGANRVGADGPTRVLAGRSRLELIPRGIARGELAMINLYHEIASGDSVSFDAVVRNTGSRVLRAVRLVVEAPSGWTARVEPSQWKEMAVGVEAKVGVTLTPPALSTSGDYEARLRLESTASDKRMESEDKIVRVHVNAPRQWFGTAALLAVVAMTLVLVLVFGARVARH
jgi:hypothetical protein